MEAKTQEELDKENNHDIKRMVFSGIVKSFDKKTSSFKNSFADSLEEALEQKAKYSNYDEKLILDEQINNLRSYSNKVKEAFFEDNTIKFRKTCMCNICRNN